MLEGGRPSGEATPEAGPDQHNAVLVYVSQGHGVVDDRRDDLLPVRAEDQTLQAAGRGLSGTVERQNVVAALDRAPRRREVALLQRGVEAAVVNDGRPRGAGVIDAEKVARQGPALVRDRDAARGHVEEFRGRREGLPGQPGEALQLGIVVRVVAPVELGRAVVVRGAQQPVPRADPVPRLERSQAGLVNPVRESAPLAAPRLLVTVRDTGAGGEHLAEIGTPRPAYPAARSASKENNSSSNRNFMADPFVSTEQIRSVLSLSLLLPMTERNRSVAV